MRPCTLRTLLQLETATWFSRVGVKDAEFAIVLSSWQEAMEYRESYEWGFLRTEALNQYCERLVQRSKERWCLWNDVVDEVKKLTEPLVESKIAAVVREHNLPKAFENQVRFDIAALCMESEYSDVHPPGFFASISYWYVNGHFPCGWKGDFPPKGTQVIY